MSSPIQPRPFTSYYVSPPAGVDTVQLSEQATPKLLWLILGGIADIPERGRALFPKPLANQNALWRDFHNYVRQARAYWNAGEVTRGSSASLLYYYCFLNLAKAELLTTSPGLISGQTIRHGLSFNPTHAQSIKGDTLKVTNGVFPHLYRKRTGISLPNGTMLSVPRLFSLVREVGLELTGVGISKPVTRSGYHAVVADAVAGWPLVLFLENGLKQASSEPMVRTFRSHFVPIESTNMSAPWRDTFAISRRRIGVQMEVYQSKKTFSLKSNGLDLPDNHGASSFLREAMHPYVGDGITENVDFTLSPSLLKSRALPLPPDLARYALMYYASSLVRYKPAALDPVRQASQAWLLDSFTRETPIFLLGNALAGIQNYQLTFETAGFRT